MRINTKIQKWMKGMTHRAWVKKTAGSTPLLEKQLYMRMMIPDFQGKHFSEHYPRETSRIGGYIRHSYLMTRTRFGRDIYYWQLRHIFMPKDRKKYDLQFLLHVENDHEGDPLLLAEKVHYRLAKKRYAKELAYVRWILDNDMGYENSDDVYIGKDPYSQAYKKQWLDSYIEHPNWKEIYHGVGIFELIEILNRDIDLRKTRLKAYKEQMGKK